MKIDSSGDLSGSHGSFMAGLIIQMQPPGVRVVKKLVHQSSVSVSVRHDVKTLKRISALVAQSAIPECASH